MISAVIEVYEKAPTDFSAPVEVSACYVEINGKVLLLQISDKKSEPGLWGVPAGKLEKGEKPEEAAKRELFEETGIVISHPWQMKSLGTLYMRKPEIDYVYHVFKIDLKDLPAVVISDEHQNYKWASHTEQQNLILMAGAKEALKYYQKVTKARAGACVNSHLILRQGDSVLLNLRKNTGYMDGQWALIAGNVEDNESATEAMIREAREEINIELSASDLKVVHIMHRQTSRFNIDIFFDCCSWKGEIQNAEPHKSEMVQFFSMTELPANFIGYNHVAIKNINNNICYSEHGWKNDS